MPELRELVQAWQLTPGLHTFNPPASAQDLSRLEGELGFRLPPALRELYLFSNGMDLFRGNLRVYPLFAADGDPALNNATAQCRGWFQIPPEVLVFGDNGADEHYGVWTAEARNPAFGHPVIEIGELFTDPACMAVVATDLWPFLIGSSAFHSLLSEAGDEALDILGLPRELRLSRKQINNEHFSRLRKWIDPGLPDPDPEPYTKGLDARQVKALIGG
jgi:hypothetical protein